MMPRSDPPRRALRQDRYQQNDHHPDYDRREQAAEWQAAAIDRLVGNFDNPEAQRVSGNLDQTAIAPTYDGGSVSDCPKTRSRQGSKGDVDPLSAVPATCPIRRVSSSIPRHARRRAMIQRAAYRAIWCSPVRVSALSRPRSSSMTGYRYRLGAWQSAQDGDRKRGRVPLRHRSHQGI
jgi:hypothetical protein